MEEESKKSLHRNEESLKNLPPEKIMQFGGGNFLRAFTDWMIDILNKETDFSGSVVIVKPTEQGDYQQLDDQDGLFHVVLDGIIDGKQQSRVDLVECVSRTIHPYRDWSAYMELARSESIRYIISNTTEAGIVFSKKDKRTDQPPAEFPGKLTRWLYERFRFFKGAEDKGCLILPCELTEDNGTKLREAVISYIDHWALEAEFKTWILEDNFFFNTLVDRIVSGYPEDRAGEIQESVGYQDPLLVAGEYYHSWIIAGDDIIREELPFHRTSLNVQLVDNITDYRELKVRVLNGAHTALVPVGYLSGNRTVDEAMEHPRIRGFIEEFLHQEVKPTLDFISDQEVNDFIDAVIDRFRNPVLAHQLLDISLNSVSKFQARLLPTMLDYLFVKKSLPKRILFALASMILFYKGEWEDEVIPLRDDADNIQFAKETWKSFDEEKITLEDLVKQWMRRLGITDKRTGMGPEITAAVAKYITEIQDKGVVNSLPE